MFTLICTRVYNTLISSKASYHECCYPEWEEKDQEFSVIFADADCPQSANCTMIKVITIMQHDFSFTPYVAYTLCHPTVFTVFPNYNFHLPKLYINENYINTNALQTTVLSIYNNIILTSSIVLISKSIWYLIHTFRKTLPFPHYMSNYCI